MLYYENSGTGGTKRYMSAENTTNTGAQEAENAEKYAVEVKNVTKIYRLYDKPIDRLERIAERQP